MKQPLNSKSYSLTIGTELSIVPERVFTAGTDDERRSWKTSKVLSVEAEAVGITS